MGVPTAFRVFDYFEYQESLKQIDLSSDTIKLALISSSWTPARGNKVFQNPSAWSGSTAYSLNNYVQPTTPNAHVYKCTSAGTSDSGEPSWPTDGTSVVDGTVTWLDMGISPAIYEISAGNGYSTGGYTIANTGVAQLITNYVMFDGDNVDIAASGGSIVFRHICIYDSSDTDKTLIVYSLYNDAPTDTTVTDGMTETVSFSTDGILQKYNSGW